MTRGTPNEREFEAALAAFRDAAHAETDARFDDRALEAQRHKILDRLAHLGQTAKVLRFPAARRSDRPGALVNRRWVSVSAAAGLLFGLVSGELVRFLPRPVTRAGNSVATPTLSRPSTAPSYAPVLISVEDDGLLGEVDLAVSLRSAAELQVLDELTPFHEPQ